MKKTKVAKSDKIIIDLTPQFMAGSKSWPKKLGRYSVSSLHSMLDGVSLPWGLPVNKYFELEEITFEAAMRMKNGVMNHEFVQKYLPQAGVEKKFEYFYYGDGDERNGTTQAHDENGNAIEPIFVVVAKVDFIEEDSVWEIKSSDKVFTSAKD